MNVKMTLKSKGLVISAMVPVLSAGLIVGVASANSNNNFGITGAQAANVAFNVSNVTTRRIYFVNNDTNGNHWYKDKQLYVYAWYGEENSGLVASSCLYADYSNWGGIHYADVSFTGCGGVIHVKFSSDDHWGAETGAAYNIPALSSKSADVVYLNNGSPSYGNAGVSANQMKSILDQMDACSDSYYDGYNAYPQINANFIAPSTFDGSTVDIADKDKQGNDGYTVADKIAQLRTNYEKNGWVTE